jgi:hypothetical protein
MGALWWWHRGIFPGDKKSIDRWHIQSRSLFRQAFNPVMAGDNSDLDHGAPGLADYAVIEDLFSTIEVNKEEVCLLSITT